MPEGVRQVIADTSPLQYLFQAGLLDLLPRLCSQVTIPEAVVLELAEGRARAVSLPDPATYTWTNWMLCAFALTQRRAPPFGASLTNFPEGCQPKTAGHCCCWKR